MEDSSFVVDNEDITNLPEEEDKRKFMSEDCKCESWEEVGDDEEIQEPPENNNYNGPYGLKPGVANRFNTVIQCIFGFTANNQYFSKTCCSEQ